MVNLYPVLNVNNVQVRGNEELVKFRWLYRSSKKTNEINPICTHVWLGRSN